MKFQHAHPMHTHSANTHHRAVRSAKTRPLHTPFSEHLMMVSHVPPSLTSSSTPLLPTLIPLRSSLRIRRRILPPGVWIASFAGFFPPDAVLGLDPLALDAVMLIAELGLANGIGLAPPGFEDGVIADPAALGCCRIAKTNVLFSARRWHCG